MNPTVHDEKNVMTRKMLAIEQFRDEWGQGAGQRALPDGADRDIHACLRGDDGQGIDQAGRHRNAGLRLYHADLLADPPVRAEPEHAEATIARIEAFSRHFIAIHGA